MKHFLLQLTQIFSEYVQFCFNYLAYLYLQQDFKMDLNFHFEEAVIEIGRVILCFRRYNVVRSMNQMISFEATYAV